MSDISIHRIYYAILLAVCAATVFTTGCGRSNSAQVNEGTANESGNSAAGEDPVVETARHLGVSTYRRKLEADLETAIGIARPVIGLNDGQKRIITRGLEAKIAELSEALAEEEADPAGSFHLPVQELLLDYLEANGDRVSAWSNVVVTNAEFAARLDLLRERFDVFNSFLRDIYLECVVTTLDLCLVLEPHQSEKAKSLVADWLRDDELFFNEAFRTPMLLGGQGDGSIVKRMIAIQEQHGKDYGFGKILSGRQFDAFLRLDRRFETFVQTLETLKQLPPQGGTGAVETLTPFRESFEDWTGVTCELYLDRLSREHEITGQQRRRILTGATEYANTVVDKKTARAAKNFWLFSYSDSELPAMTLIVDPGFEAWINNTLGEDAGASFHAIAQKRTEKHRIVFAKLMAEFIFREEPGLRVDQLKSMERIIAGNISEDLDKGLLTTFQGLIKSKTEILEMVNAEQKIQLEEWFGEFEYICNRAERRAAADEDGGIP